MEGKFLLYSVLECLTLLQGQTVALGNDRYDVDDVAQLLQHDDINGFEGMSRGLDEEQAAMDACVLDVALTLGREFLVQIGPVLVFDELDNGVPATVVVDAVAVARGVDNVEAEADAVLFDDMGGGLDFGGAADWLLWGDAALGVEEMGCEDGVDESGFAQTGLTCNCTIRMMLIPANEQFIRQETPERRTYQRKSR